MRDLGSIVLAGVVAPVVYILVGRGLVRFSAAIADPSDWFTALAAVATLGMAGALYALLVMVRLSPMGPALAGLSYAAAGAWALIDPADMVALLPSDMVGFGVQELIAAAGVTPLLAVPLLLTMFSTRRWRGHDLPDAAPTYRVPSTPPHPYPASPPAQAQVQTQLMHSGPSAGEPFPVEYPSDPLRLVYSGPGVPARWPAEPAGRPAEPDGETTQTLPSALPTEALPTESPRPEEPGEPTQAVPSEETTARLQPDDTGQATLKEPSAGRAGPD